MPVRKPVYMSATGVLADIASSDYITGSYTRNFGVVGQSGFAADTYLAGSFIPFITPPIIGSTYELSFDCTKSNLGIAPPTISLRIGTVGGVADSARNVFTFGAGTLLADSGLFSVIATFKSVGSGTSAVLQATASLLNNMTTTGLSNGIKCVPVTSAGFDSTAAGLGIGASYNAGTAAAHTVKLVNARLIF